MKLLVCGGRDFNDYDAVYKEIVFLYNNTSITEIVQGGAKGADSLGEIVAKEIGLSCIEFPANWNKYGKGAGHIRNKQMLDYLDEGDIVVAFPGGKGTANMVSIAKKAGFTVRDKREKET